MYSPESPTCGGMFREEIAQQLLISCASLVRSCFGDLYQQCDRKQDGDEVFRSCIDMVRTGWVEDDFQDEMRAAPTDFDAQVRGSFIVFVRQTNTDATGANTVHVRVTLPPTIAFLREFLRAISVDDDLRNGVYFRSQTRLEQKDVVMQAIRGAMKSLCSEFVYIPDKGVDLAPLPVLRPNDSVSEADEASGEEAEERESESVEEPASDISVKIRNAPEISPKRHHHGGHRKHGGARSNVSEKSRHSARSHRSASVATSKASYPSGASVSTHHSHYS